MIIVVPANAEVLTWPIETDDGFEEERILIDSDMTKHVCPHHELLIHRVVDTGRLRDLLSKWRGELQWYKDHDTPETPRGVGVSWLEEHITELDRVFDD